MVVGNLRGRCVCVCVCARVRACGRAQPTSVLTCSAPMALMDAAVPAYGHSSPSSLPTVTDTPGNRRAASTGAMQHKPIGFSSLWNALSTFSTEAAAPARARV